MGSDDAGGEAMDGGALAEPDWLVVFHCHGGARVDIGEWFFLTGLPTDTGTVDVALHSRYEDAGVSHPVPRELVIEVVTRAPDVDAALALAGLVANAISVMLSAALNAAVAIPEPVIAFDATPDVSRRGYWQRYAPVVTALPAHTRLIHKEWIGEYLKACFTAAEFKRVTRAISQYQLALMYWTTRGRPLALAHLYMAMEALAPAIERVERARLGLPDDKSHALHRGVDVARSNWREVLLGWIRRDIICQGDKATYDAARKASDGFEHGSLDLPAFRKMAEASVSTVFDYVRRAILGLLDLDPAIAPKLEDKKPLDVSPLWMEVRGEMHGSVANPRALGEANSPYPYFDWESVLDDFKVLEDGRTQVSPRHNLKFRAAPEVKIDLTNHAVAVGASDPSLFTHEPPVGPGAVDAPSSGGGQESVSTDSGDGEA